MSDQTPDEKVARALGCSPAEVAQARQHWNNNRVMREVFRQRFLQTIEVKRNALESLGTESIKSTQGEIAGIRAGFALATMTEE